MPLRVRFGDVNPQQWMEGDQLKFGPGAADLEGVLYDIGCVNDTIYACVSMVNPFSDNVRPGQQQPADVMALVPEAERK